MQFLFKEFLISAFSWDFNKCFSYKVPTRYFIKMIDGLFPRFKATKK